MKYLKNDKVVAKISNKNQFVNILSIEENIYTVQDEKFNKHNLELNQIVDYIVPADRPVVINWATSDGYEKEYGKVIGHFIDDTHGHSSYTIKTSAGKLVNVFHYQVKPCANSFTPAEYQLRHKDPTVQ